MGEVAALPLPDSRQSRQGPKTDQGDYSSKKLIFEVFWQFFVKMRLMNIVKLTVFHMLNEKITHFVIVNPVRKHQNHYNGT